MNDSPIRSPARLLLGFALIALAAAAPLQADDHQKCSNHGAAGSWSYRFSGSLISDPNNDGYPNDFPANGVGTLTLDPSGNVSGGGPFKTGCCLSQLTFTGTSSVHADCTGSLTLEIYQDGVDQGSFVIDEVFGDNANAFHWILTDPYHVISLDGQRQFHN